MKNKYLKLRKWLLMALLSALGVAGCNKHKDPEPPACMYGPPEMFYENEDNGD